MNDNNYALKNAFVYTGLIAIILLAPLYIYMIYMKSVYDIRNELELKQRAHMIVRSMEEFNARNEPTFVFPRSRVFQSGLYDRHFKPVFSVIELPLTNYTPGYHIDEDHAYYILPLPEQRYFDASYLIVSNELSYVGVYERVVMILLSIAVLIFLLSLLFLNQFALPFKRVNRKLDNFIKDSMHEINTPLSIISVNIDLFNRKNPTNKYLTRIKAATKTLSNIYNDMDYLIKNEKLTFVEEKINLKAFVQERIEYFSEVAAMKNITIASMINCDSSLMFNTTQLQRIVDNNLSNAIKYSHEGSVIEVILENSDEGCSLIFKDYGIGIEDTERIFERYYREEGDKGGFGIGLNIVKAIIDSAGIKVKVRSENAQGSSFCYTFPSAMIAEKQILGS